MEHIISEYITFFQKYSPFELVLIQQEQYLSLPPEKLSAILFGFNPRKMSHLHP